MLLAGDDRPSGMLEYGWPQSSAIKHKELSTYVGWP